LVFSILVVVAARAIYVSKLDCFPVYYPSPGSAKFLCRAELSSADAFYGALPALKATHKTTDATACPIAGTAGAFYGITIPTTTTTSS
jgi:hypothetical protein